MIRKVLVVRFRRVGDAVVSSVICNTLRLNFPDAEIHYVLNEAIAPLFEGHPAVDRVIPFSERENHTPRLYLRKVWCVMRRGRYDALIDLRGTLKTSWFSIFAPGVPYRIGRRKWYNCLWFNHRVTFSAAETVSEVRENLHMLRPLKRERPLRYVTAFDLSVTKAETAAFREYMKECGVDFSRPVMVCAPLTRVPGKEWDKARMREVLARILREYGAQLVINYAPAEREAAVELYEAMGRPSGMFIDVEARGLRQLGALLSNAGFFFGNEGGARHMAQAFGLPCFAIYPPQVSLRKWLPHPGERNRHVSPRDYLSSDEWNRLTDAERFDTLTVDRVWAALRPMLAACLRH